MAMNGEVGAEAPGAVRRYEPYGTAAGATEAAGKSGSSPGRFTQAWQDTLASVTAVPTTPGPAAVAVHTPPTRPAAAITPPQAMEPPQAGCSTEELRVWMIHIVKNMGKDLNLFEASMAGAVNRV